MEQGWTMLFIKVPVVFNGCGRVRGGRLIIFAEGATGESATTDRGLTICTIFDSFIRMKTRVTITLEPEVHQLAKKCARRRRTTVSGLIASLLQAEAIPRKRGIVSQMIGSATLREPAPGEDPLYDALAARHLRS